MKVFGGPNNILQRSGERIYLVCSPDSITSSEIIDTKQKAMVGDLDPGFKVAKYAETDSNCPDVDTVKAYEKDCSTISSAFQNSDNLMTTLSSGYLWAKLVNNQDPSSHEFCLGVSSSVHSITVPNLEFTLEALENNCKTALSKVPLSNVQFDQMYSSTE
jgi:hypothetical protein